MRHLQGDLAAARLADEIAAATRRYAKRQETWFRHQLGQTDPVLVLDAAAEPAGLAATIVRQWAEGTS